MMKSLRNYRIEAEHTINNIYRLYEKGYTSLSNARLAFNILSEVIGGHLESLDADEEATKERDDE